jgi:hypothetical protein
MTARYRARAKNQGHVDADSLAGDLRDRHEAFRGGRDLHEHVVAVHCGPQGAGHVRGCGGVTGQPGVDLDGDPPVFPGCLPVNRERTSQAARTSSVVTVKTAASVLAPCSARSLSWASYRSPFARAEAKIGGLVVTPTTCRPVMSDSSSPLASSSREGRPAKPPRPGRTARRAGHGGCHWSCPGLPDQAMTASTVFFSALGWAGDRGAFFRACSSLAPSS